MSDFSEYFTNDSSSSPSGESGGVNLDDFFGGTEVNLFDGVDMDSLPEDPYSLPENTYKWRVTSIELKPTKNNPDKLGLTLKYAVAEGAYRSRESKPEWIHYPNPKDGSTEEEKVRAYAAINNLLTALGYSEDQKKAFNHRNYKDVLGAEFWCNGGSKPQRDNPQYKEIRLWGMKSPVGGPLDSNEVNPFA